MERNAEPDLTGYSLEGYVFKKHLGSGAFGSVWLCEQSALDRYVAIKVLKREGKPAQSRFLKEARLASKLRHPNAAHVYGFGIAEPPIGFWIAMEFVAGVTLDKWLEKLVRMTPEQFVPFFLALAGVVQAAHDRNIVHRDLKPSNVMVVEDRGLIPKLLDLGIAREGVYPATIADDRSAEFHAEDRVAIEALADVEPGGAVADAAPADDVDVVALAAGDGDAAVDAAPRSTVDAATSARPPDLGETHRGVGAGAARGRLTPLGGFRLGRLGTQHYMSPEQWTNPSEVGHESDLYSLGVIAFQCLVGKVPFHAEDSQDLHLMHMVRPVPSLGAAFSAEVDAVIARALAKDPSDRYSTVVEFAEELASALRRLPQRQLTSRAQMWDDAGRPASLVLSRSELLHIEARSELERAFLAASHEHATRGVRRLLVLRTLAATCVTAIGAVTLGSYLVLKAERSEQDARVAKAVAETAITQANLEQGRAGLLHNEPGAAPHLAKAYKQDPEPTTAFMLARALQPRLAEQARFTSTFGPMWAGVFSPDGKQVLTADDRNAQVWDAQSQRLVFTLAHGDSVYHAVYSADGTRIFTACGDGAVRLWDANTGALVRELRHKGRSLRYRALSISPNGSLVAAIDVAGSVVHVWDVGSGAMLAALRNEAAAFPSVAFSADGHWLATSGGKDARVFDVRGWLQVIVIPRVRCMSWDPAGRHLVTGNVNGDVSLWDVPGGRRIHHLRDLGDAVTAVAYAPDGKSVVAASREGTEYVWDTMSGELRNQGNYVHDAIRSIEFDVSSTFTVAAGMNGVVVVADAKRGAAVTVLSGPSNVVVGAHFDVVARRVIGASWDGTVRIWGSEAPYRQWGVPPVADSCGVITGLEPDRRIVAIKCADHPTQVWDTIRGEKLAELPSIVSAGDDFSSAQPAISAVGDRAAIARGSAVEVYALPGGTLLRTVAHAAAVNAVAFAPNGLDLVTGTVGGSLIVTHDNGSQLVLPVAPAGVDAAAILPDGRVVAADASRQLRVYDTHGTVTATINVAARVFALRMSSDGRYVITLPKLVGKSASPELWEVADGRLIACLDEPGQGHVWAARFVDGSVLTASADGAARRWDAATGQLQQKYSGGSRFLGDAMLSPDGSMIVGGGADGLLRFWDARSGVPLWILPAHQAAVVGIYMEGDDIVTRGTLGDISRWRLSKPEQVIEACGHNKLCATVMP